MIRLGIIGTGRIAKRAVKEIKTVGGLEVIAVLNPNLEHAENFARENGIPEYTGNTDGFIEILAQNTEIYSDSKSVGNINDRLNGATDACAVYIATPHGTHYDYAKKMLEAGIHVICEKPLCFSAEQAEELFRIADEKKLVLMEAIKTDYCPGFKKLCEVVGSGIIGDVVDVEAAFTRLTPPGCREFTDKKYGGSFTEFGSYTMLPIFRFLGTEYKSINAYVRHVIYEGAPNNVSGYIFHDNKRMNDASNVVRDNLELSAVDGYTKIHFEYDNNKFATAKTGLTVKSEGQLLISGSKGYILVPSPWWLTKYFEVRFEDPKCIDKYECEFEGDGLRYEFAEFVSRVGSMLTADAPAVDKKEQEEAVARAGGYECFFRTKNNK